MSPPKYGRSETNHKVRQLPSNLSPSHDLSVHGSRLSFDRGFLQSTSDAKDDEQNSANEIDRISRASSKSSPATRSRDSTPTQTPTQTPVSNTLTWFVKTTLTSPKKAAQKTKARLAFSSAIALISDLRKAVSNFQDPFKGVRYQSQRDLHVQNILHLQRRHVPTLNMTHTQEKILLICACLSLSSEFGDFERRHGWVPKSVQLAQRIIEGRDTAVQTIGKHLSNYVSNANQHSASLTRKNLDSAIRFGIKLEVIDAVGEVLGLPSCLSLLMGFECIKFSRLSFTAFEHLRNMFETPSKERDRLLRFANDLSPWWTWCRKEYQASFGSATRAQSLEAAETSTHHLQTSSTAEMIFSSPEMTRPVALTGAQSLGGYQHQPELWALLPNNVSSPAISWPNFEPISTDPSDGQAWVYDPRSTVPLHSSTTDSGYESGYSFMPSNEIVSQWEMLQPTSSEGFIATLAQRDSPIVPTTQASLYPTPMQEHESNFFAEFHAGTDPYPSTRE